MTATTPRHTLDELRQLGEEILHRAVLPNTAADDHGKYVAINVDTREYEIAGKLNDAIDQHLARDPDSYLLLALIGYPALMNVRPRLRVFTSASQSNLGREMV